MLVSLLRRTLRLHMPDDRLFETFCFRKVLFVRRRKTFSVAGERRTLHGAEALP